MPTTFLSNAFSLSMLPAEGHLFTVRTQRVTTAMAKSILVQGEFKSIVGHESTASVLATVLGTAVSVNRVSATLETGDVLVVAQYNGPRLPEGATVLPRGASMEFMVVRVGMIVEGKPFDV